MITTTLRRLPNVGTEDEFFEKFKPVNQSSDPDEVLILIDWNSPEFEAVRKSPPQNVWTVVDCDTHENDSGLVISAGFQWVNRVGYVITEMPWVTGNEEYDY